MQLLHKTEFHLHVSFFRLFCFPRMFRVKKCGEDDKCEKNYFSASVSSPTVISMPAGDVPTTFLSGKCSSHVDHLFIWKITFSFKHKSYFRWEMFNTFSQTNLMDLIFVRSVSELQKIQNWTRSLSLASIAALQYKA